MVTAFTSTLAALPEPFHERRRELLDLLVRDAILRQTPAQPVVARDGTSARWMLDSLSVTLQGRGAQLAADCMIDLLERFDGVQLATYGLTAVPLLQSVIVRSNNKYSGLLIRKSVKAHGSMRRIEGKARAGEPVVLIDDSISSGLSMETACRHLEEAGLRVEGAAVLVRFGWENGCASLQSRGYHIESVFDVWRDLMPRIPGEPQLTANPTKEFGNLPWDEDSAPNGLNPPSLAREILSSLFLDGRLLRPPEFLDKDYDSAGGAWVSLRDQYDIHCRYGREGFWHLPGETRWGAAEEIVRACWLLFQQLQTEGYSIEILKRGVLAVTFFGELEQTSLAGLDNDRYGIVVCSQERPSIMGGALPRMPGIGSEWQQYNHAAYKNAGLRSHEPHLIYRHSVSKAVEKGVRWQRSGVPLAKPSRAAANRSNSFRTATRYARNLAISQLGRAMTVVDAAQEAAVSDLDSMYVTIYYDGKLSGCAGSCVTDIRADLSVLVYSALRDDRFEPLPKIIDPKLLAVSVSFLFDALVLGELEATEVSTRYRLGEQALAVRQGNRYGILLPFAAVMYNLDRTRFAEEVLRKAKIETPAFEWIRYECSTWLSDKRGCEETQFGFRRPEPGVSFHGDLLELAGWHSDYLLRNQSADADFYFVYDPFSNCRYKGGGLPRSAHASWTLARAGHLLNRLDLKLAAARAVDYHLALARVENNRLWLCRADEPSTISELAFTLLALLELPEKDADGGRARLLMDPLWSQVNPHGKITTHRDDVDVPDEYQDYFPGQAMLALANAAAKDRGAFDQDVLAQVLRFYRHRFWNKRDFGQVSWWMQASRRWWEVTHASEWSDFAFAIGDWILEFQLVKNGGFITGHQADGPGYTSGLYLEGIAAGCALARQLNDKMRLARYRQACDRGFEFLRSLVIRPEHDSVLPNAAYALGGLRADFRTSELRTDFVQHSLCAALDVLAQTEADGTCKFNKGGTNEETRR